jgi:transcriptional regulator GlxA family with amidase domain
MTHYLAVARYLVVYMRRGGSDPQLSPWLEGRNHVHPVVHRVQDAIAADPRRPWSNTSLAKLAGTSPRQFRDHTGLNLPDYKAGCGSPSPTSSSSKPSSTSSTPREFAH